MAACVLQHAAYAQNQIDGIAFESESSFQEVLCKAQVEKKLVFVDCYTTWCGPCKQMSANVFPMKEVGDYFNPRFVSVKIDMEKGEGVELCRKYDVNAFPTFLFLEADGSVRFRLVGASPAQRFISMVAEGMQQEPMSLLKQKYENGEMDIHSLASYVNTLNKSYMNHEKEMVANDLFSRLTVDDLLGDSTLCDCFLSNLPAADHPLFLEAYKKKDVFSRISGKKADGMETNWMKYPERFIRLENRKYVGFDTLGMERYAKLMEEYQVPCRETVKTRVGLVVSSYAKDYVQLLRHVEDYAASPQDVTEYQMFGYLSRLAEELSDPALLQRVKELAKGRIACLKEKQDMHIVKTKRGDMPYSEFMMQEYQQLIDK